MRVRTQLATSLVLLAAASARAQTASTPKEPPPLTAQFNRNLIFLDPAHGGPDSGAHLTNTLAEKDVTLALALRLRDALTARGFTVVLARQSDDPNSPALDDRAGAANHLRPVACILLHATSASRGVHLYASSLTPPAAEPRALPWDTAQAPWVPQSLRLANELGTALARSHTPVLIHRADPKPLSSLTCPAIALELSPLPGDNNSLIPVNNTAYQQRVADALAGALIFWKTHADPRPASSAPVTNPSNPLDKLPQIQPYPSLIHPTPSTPAPRPTPKPAPKPAATPTPAPEKPAPIQPAPAQPAPVKPAPPSDDAPQPARLVTPAITLASAEPHP